MARRKRVKSAGRPAPSKGQATVPSRRGNRRGGTVSEPASISSRAEESARLVTPARADGTVTVTGWSRDGNTVTLREWDRATRFLAWFAVTGWLAEVTDGGEHRSIRPASVLLCGEAGSGKTELLRRFRGCYWLSYHADLTVRPLLSLLYKAQAGAVTHVAAEEFNKFFQRKASTAENCIGLLSAAMEEGVSNYNVGPTVVSLDFARLGLFAGMTPGTLNKRREMLSEMGFLSRACVIPWHLPREERDTIMGRMNRGDDSDLATVRLSVPRGGQRAAIQWDVALGPDLQEYVRMHWPENDLRIFQRLRGLMMANAYLRGSTNVERVDLDAMFAYGDYWERMVLS